MIPIIGTLLRKADDLDAIQFQRVLWISPDRGHVALIDCEDSQAMPYFVDANTLLSDLKSGCLSQVQQDPFLPTYFEAHLTPAERRTRDRATALMITVLEFAPTEYLLPATRTTILRNAAQKADINISLNTAYRYYRLYWQRGMTWNAMIPKFKDRGGRGGTQNAKHQKRGKRSILEVADGVTGVTPTGQILEHMTRSLNLFYMGQRRSLADTCQAMWEHFFADGLEWVDGVPKAKLKPIHQRPTYAQLRYLRDKLYRQDTGTVLRRRYGYRRYAMKFAPTINRQKRLTDGPGQCYLGDGLIVKIHLVNNIDPSVPNGFPNVYGFMDAFSHRWVGFYVTYENLSYHVAMLAFLNACTDKSELLRRLNINDSWTGAYKPRSLFVDNGELKNGDWLRLGAALDIDQVRAPPYRPDLKGLIEKAIDLLKKMIKSLSGTQKAERQPGEAHPAIESRFNLDEFTRALILAALSHNKHHKLGIHDLDDDMRRAHVPPFPDDVWNWGLQHRPHHLREVSPDLLRLHILPGGKAKVTRSGLEFKGQRYHSRRLQEEGYYARAGAREVQKSPKPPPVYVDVAFDPWNVPDVSLRMKGQTALEPLELLGDGFKRASFLDLDSWDNRERLDHARRQQQSDQDRMRLNTEFDEMDRVARQRGKIHRDGRPKKHLITVQPGLLKRESEQRRKDSSLTASPILSQPLPNPVSYFAASAADHSEYPEWADEEDADA